MFVAIMLHFLTSLSYPTVLGYGVIESDFRACCGKCWTQWSVHERHFV